MGIQKKYTQREALEALPLPGDQLRVARAGGARGQNLHDITFADGTAGLCLLPPRFRNVIWVKRGHYLLVDVSEAASRDNKLTGEIAYVLRPVQVRHIQQKGLWPVNFSGAATTVGGEADDDDDDDDDEDAAATKADIGDSDDDDAALFVNTNRRPVVASSSSEDEEEDDDE